MYFPPLAERISTPGFLQQGLLWERVSPAGAARGPDHHEAGVSFSDVCALFHLGSMEIPIEYFRF
jgi:hypothetical protein